VIVLCDTSSILMLLRIAPQMFDDERFGCVTIKEVHKEITRTAKFKSKYPWTGALRAKIKPLPASKTNTSDIKLYHDTISTLNVDGVVDEKTERLFNLSREDMRIMACALGLGYFISSGDGGIIRFLSQQFPDDFKGNISPLGLINRWLEGKLITWDEEKQMQLAEWNENEEHAQPKDEITRFKRLTRRQYPGS